LERGRRFPKGWFGDLLKAGTEPGLFRIIRNFYSTDWLDQEVNPGVLDIFRRNWRKRVKGFTRLSFFLKRRQPKKSPIWIREVKAKWPSIVPNIQ